MSSFPEDEKEDNALASIASIDDRRYTAILVFSIVCLFVYLQCLPLILYLNFPYSRIGHIILVASASPASLAHPDTALGLLILSIVVIVRTYT